MTSAKMMYGISVAMMKERVEIRQCLLFSIRKFVDNSGILWEFLLQKADDFS